MAGKGMGSQWTTDRIVLGVCAAIWLVWLGVSVAALVALVDLGRGFQNTARDSHTGLLYAIIAISALIILAAIPILLHARRAPQTRPPARRGSAPPRRPVHSDGRSGNLATEQLRAAGSGAALPEGAIDHIWLRGTAALVGVMGGAWTVVAEATYLMAVGKDGAAWIGYGIAGVITAALPVILWLYLRQLRDVLIEYRP
jgi:hypothetical protein